MLLLFFFCLKVQPLVHILGIETKSWLKIIPCCNGALEIKARGSGWAALFKSLKALFLPSSTILMLLFPLFAQMAVIESSCSICSLMPRENSCLFIKLWKEQSWVGWKLRIGSNKGLIVPLCILPPTSPRSADWEMVKGKGWRGNNQRNKWKERFLY